MANAANILQSLVPISQFNKGKAAQIFDRLRTEKELIVLKNNQPSAGDKPGISFTNVLNDLGISESDLDDAEEVAIE